MGIAKGSHVLITGATSGIGRSSAILLARSGYSVIATGRNQAQLDWLRQECEGLSLMAFRLDVTDPDSIRQAVVEVERITHGAGLDALVNNAGYGQSGPLELVGDPEVRSQFETNVFGLLAVTRAFLPGMRKRGKGRIVNVSSMVGRIALPLQGIYCATKFAVEALSDVLRREVHGFGISVSVIEPGAIRTSFEETAVRSVASCPVDGTPYERPMAKWKTALAGMYAKAVGPDVIARAVLRVLTARRPCARYVSPWHGRLLLWLVALLPERVLDALLRKALGLTRGELRGGGGGEKT